MHGELFDGPPPAETRTEPPWPGYDPTPAEEPKQGVLGKVFRKRGTTDHAA